MHVLTMALYKQGCERCGWTTGMHGGQQKWSARQYVGVSTIPQLQWSCTAAAMAGPPSSLWTQPR